ncbi:alpha/beta fold hydrolase [Streptomyces sp. NPDC051976]|uniref:thioesterase II family protein n=1 Tax=Streptomyces sp. NPDC051976 TaxID=3154947 RepID=UPI0034213353
MRLLCLPHAGAGASTYHQLSAKLADTAEVLCAQYPGRQDRISEPCPDTVEALADGVYSALSPHDTRPLTVFGHSMGALIGYEIVRRLEAEGRPVTALFASARQAPSQLSPPFGGLDPTFPTDAWILAKMGELDGTDADILGNAEALEFMLPALRSDFRAVYSYARQPAAQLRCRIVALVGDSDPDVSVADARAWRNETTGPFTLHVVPGGHFHLTDTPATVADLLRGTLTAAGGGHVKESCDRG